MFKFFEMMNNYEDRKVARDDYGWGFISTAWVNDGDKPYETAIEHEKYNDGEMVIVQAYDTREEAADAHQLWVQVMRNPPSELADCLNSEIMQEARKAGKEFRFKRID